MKPVRILIFTLASAAAVSARGNVVGNDTQNFNPITSGVDFITVQGTRTLAPGVLNLGYFVNGARDVLPDTLNAAGERLSSAGLLTGQDVNIGYGVTGTLDVGLNIATMLSQTTDRTEPGAQFSKTGLNEIRANAKYSLLARRPVGVALIGSVNFNQVRNNPFLGKDGGPTANLEVAVDAEIGNFVMALNAGYRARDSGGALEDSLYKPISDQVIGSVAVSRYLPGLDTKLIGEVFASRQVSSDGGLQAHDVASEALAGLKYDWSDRAAVNAGFGYKLSDGLFAPSGRLYVGLNYTFDLIPSAPPAASAPSPVVKMSETVYYKGYQPDDIEKLSRVSFDRLMEDREFVLLRAVPENPAGTDKPPFEVVRLDGLDFPFGSSEILPKHRALLDRLVKYINAPPLIYKIRVEGHTDSIGSEERNRLRSTGRARAVLDDLRAHGMDPRIGAESVGFGSARPIADNGNFQGRQLNRRVEVRLLRHLDVPADRVRTTEP